MCGLGEWPPFHSLPSPPHPFPSLLLSHLASNCTHNPDIDLWDAGFAVVASLPPAPGSADGPHGAGLGWRQASSNALLLLMAEAPEAGSTCDVKRDLVQCQKRPSHLEAGKVLEPFSSSASRVAEAQALKHISTAASLPSSPWQTSCKTPSPTCRRLHITRV